MQAASMSARLCRGIAVLSLMGGGNIVWAAGYVGPAPIVAGVPGLILPPPSSVTGKEYSSDDDTDESGVGDFGQLIAWDGFGGTVDGIDYSAGLGAPSIQVDAIANHNDLLFDAVALTDSASLLFSVDDAQLFASSPTPGTLSHSGTIKTNGGHIIGKAGDISYEKPAAAALPLMGKWADGPTAISITAPPRDVDGLEVWGGEVPTEPPLGLGDSDRFSVKGDALPLPGGAGASVLSWDPATKAITPYVTHAMVAGSVISLLDPANPGHGFATTGLEPFAINLDALMVYDPGLVDDFEFGPGDVIMFSIEQITNAADPDGFYATGSEVFLMTSTGAISILAHGGHLWDHAWTLANMKAVEIDGIPLGSPVQLDLDALEAVSVPEPATLGLLLPAGLLALRRSRRWA